MYSYTTNPVNYVDPEGLRIHSIGSGAPQQRAFIALLQQAAPGLNIRFSNKTSDIIVSGEANGNPIAQFLLNASGSDTILRVLLENGESTDLGNFTGNNKNGAPCYAQRIDLDDFKALSDLGDKGKIYGNALLYHELAEGYGIAGFGLGDASSLPVPAAYQGSGRAIPPFVKKGMHFHVNDGFSAENAYFKFKGLNTRRTGDYYNPRSRKGGCQYSDGFISFDKSKSVLSPELNF